MARPPKAREARRTRQIIFRLTEDEYLHLLAVATRAGMPPNLLARMLVVQRNQDIVVATTQRLDPALIKRLDRIGWNLNQLVKNAHIFGRVPPTVGAMCEELRRIVRTATDDEQKEST
jgi:Mobilization protein NikA